MLTKEVTCKKHNFLLGYYLFQGSISLLALAPCFLYCFLNITEMM